MAPSEANSAPAALVGRIAPRITALVFVLGFLVSLAWGCSLMTALVRGMVGATVAMVVAPLLVWPVARAVVDAAVHEEQQRARVAAESAAAEPRGETR